MEQQRAEACEQKRRRHVKAGQNRDQDRRAEHREHVLEAQDEHSARAELSCIIDAFFGNLLFTHCNLLPLFRASDGRASRAQKKGTVNGNTNHNSCILEKHQSGVLKTLPPETKTGAPRMISGQIVCFIAMHSLPYFYRQPLYRPGSRKASVSFAIFSAAVSAKFHVFYKKRLTPVHPRSGGSSRGSAP